MRELNSLGTLTGTLALALFAACGPKKLAEVTSKDNSSRFASEGNGKAWSASVSASAKYCVKFSTEPNACILLRFTADKNDKLVLKDSGKGTCGIEGNSITGKYLTLGCKSETGESCLKSTDTKIIVNLNASSEISGNEKMVADSSSPSRNIEFESADCADKLSKLAELAEALKNNTQTGDVSGNVKTEGEQVNSEKGTEKGTETGDEKDSEMGTENEGVTKPPTTTSTSTSVSGFANKSLRITGSSTRYCIPIEALGANCQEYSISGSATVRSTKNRTACNVVIGSSGDSITIKSAERSIPFGKFASPADVQKVASGLEAVDTANRTWKLSPKDSCLSSSF